MCIWAKGLVADENNFEVYRRAVFAFSAFCRCHPIVMSQAAPPIGRHAGPLGEQNCKVGIRT